MSSIYCRNRTWSLVVLSSVSALLTSMPRLARADFLPVYAGPSAVSTAPFGTGVNGTGTAIANNGIESCNEFGCTWQDRGFRWNTTDTTILGGLDPFTFGYFYSRANSINDAGTVVGSAIQYDDAGYQIGERAVRWAPGTSAPTELPNLGASSEWFTSRAVAINAVGMAVGHATKYSGQEYGGERAVRWDAAGTVVTELGHLGAPGGFTRTAAGALNASGTAAGNAYKYDATDTWLGPRAVRWDSSTTAATELTYPAPINGTLYSQATAINDGGVVVGYGQVWQSWEGLEVYVGGDAVRWDASGAAARLVPPAPTHGEFTQSIARAINSAGTTIGVVEEYYYDYNCDDNGGCSGPIPVLRGSRALRWDASGTSPTVLGNLGQNPNGFTDSNAYAINSAETTVGYATRYGPGLLSERHAVYWGDDGVAVDLNSLIDPESGWLLSSAQHISDTGWIAGVGQFDPDGPGGQDGLLRHFLIHVPATAVIPQIPPGDFNHDGTVDAADYVVWRKNPGAFGGDPAGYDTWRANFGATLGSGSSQLAALPQSSVIPEPTSGLLFLSFAAMGLWKHRRGSHRPQFTTASRRSI